VEALTDRLEAEALQLMQELEARGGLKEALETGWMDQEIERAALEEQRRMETGERRVVGVNVFRSEEPERETPGSVLRVSEEAMREYREGVRRLRQERSQAAVVRSLHNLQREAERGPQRNLLPAIMEAVRAYATHGEILGIIRQAYGYPYDPLGVLEAPCWEAA
jgi:Methylmalonyl-CoA mutase, N-terminal domain/subunit